MNKRDILSILILVSIIILGIYRYKHKSYEVRQSRWILGTQVDMTVKCKSKEINKIVEKAIDLMKDYENKISYYKEGSEVWKINNSSETNFIVSDDLVRLITISKKLYDESGHLFDPSIGPVTDLWNFEDKIIPSQDKIDSALVFVGLDKITLDGNKLFKPVGIKLNFGAVAKGYIIDKALDYLKNQNVEKAIINAGGDIRIYSQKNERIKVGIRHPRGDFSDIIATLSLGNSAVVTSGDYEQFFDLNGKRYHHILNPLTGYPQEGTFSVTVIAETAGLADALSTTLFLMSPDDGIELLKKYPNSSAIIYYIKNGELISLKSTNIKPYLVGEYVQ